MNQEFLDHALMDDDKPPSCPLESLKRPRLRRCEFDVSSLVITGPITPIPNLRQQRVDGGLDGYNWKIRFGNSGPFVLKVFWDQEPPRPPMYYALQRECQAAAVLQLMQAALAQCDSSLGPILVYPQPWDWIEGYENMLAFISISQPIKMPTVLKALAEKSVAKGFNNANSLTGLNSRCDTGISIESWHLWEDFTYDNIEMIFRKELGRRYKGEGEPQPLPLDLLVLKEDATQDALGRDTKISSKWRSSMLEDSDDDENSFEERKKVLDQVVSYVASWFTRYGFIITDTEVVALRITRQYVSAGIAAQRTRRRRSGATIIPSSDPLIGISTSSTKRSPGPAVAQGDSPGKLALWALARTASYGDRGIEYSYPDLDTWRTQDSGHGIIHNTSGVVLEKPTKHTKIQQRDHFSPTAEGPEHEEEDLYGDEEDTSDAGASESEAPSEPELPQFSRTVSTGPESFVRLPHAQISQTASREQDERILVSVERRGKEYFYRDSKGNRRSSAKSDWKAVQGGYLLCGKRHVYFAKKLP
ncbi:hypothetical protein MY11210_005498 [Beauveria gryllotalpidicola]